MIKSRLAGYLGLLVVIVNVVLLAPVLDTPYLGDDSWCESTIRGTAQLSGKDLGTICWRTVGDYVHSGRWYPAIIYYYPVFYYLDRYAYKVVGLAFIVLNVILFGYFMSLLTGSQWAGLASMLLAPLSFQLRFYHDPIMSYYYLMQVELSLILVSLILLIHYLRSGRWGMLWWSVAAYTVCMLVYEAFYAIWILHGAIAYLHLRKESLARVCKVTAPFLAAATLNAGLTVLMRSLYAARYEGIALSFSPIKWFVTWIKQSSAAIPMSYAMFSSSIESSVLYARENLAADLFIVCCLWLLSWLMVWEAFRNDSGTEPSSGAGSSAIVGIGLWVLPATLVSLSSKYQSELTWGLGYLPVYVSGFGVIMVAVAGLLLVRAYKGRLGTGSGMVSATLVGLAGAIVCGVTYNTNRMVVQRYGYVEHYHRALIENAMHCGLFRSVPEGSILVCARPIRAWDSPSFFRMHSGLTLDVVRPEGFPPDAHLANSTVEKAFGKQAMAGSCSLYRFRGSEPTRSRTLRYSVVWQGVEGPVLVKARDEGAGSLDGPAYFLKYEAQANGMGYAVIARIVDLAADNKQCSGVTADRVFLYVAAPFGYPYAGVVVSWLGIDPQTLKSTTGFQVREKELKMLCSDIHGKVFEIPVKSARHLFDAKSIVAVVTPVGDSCSSFSSVHR